LLSRGGGRAAPGAAPWPQKKGESLFIATTLVDRADRAWSDNREIVDDGFFYKDEFAIYGEYGLSDRFTLVGRVAWQDVRRRNGVDYDSAEGFSASEIGVRALLGQRARNVFAVQALALIPGQGENVSNQPLGHGGEAWEARGLWGRSVSETVFTDVQFAWRWRADEFLDEARFDATLGWRPADQWLLLAQTFSVWSAETPRPGNPGFDQHKVQASIGRQVGSIEYHFGLYATPAGRNTVEERAVFISMWQRF
jgi:hypothetical protein